MDKENKMKKIFLNEQTIRMQKLAGINESSDIFNGQYEVDNETYEKMDSLVNRQDYINFINSATKIMSTLSKEGGFEAKQAFYYLYTRLTANV